MNLVDSSGWIEFFTDGALASEYEKHLEPPSKNIVPTIVLYEVYKKIKKERHEEVALVALSIMQNSEVISLTSELSLRAADISLQYGLAMADAVIYATALQRKATVFTSDSDLRNLPSVTYYPKKL